MRIPPSTLVRSRRPAGLLLMVAATGIVSLTGCGVARLIPSAPSASAFHLHGKAHGGQQPVSGASIQLYTAGSSGNFSAATPMLTSSVSTDASGAFDITGDYTCSSSSAQVYITATGGNPGLGGNTVNPALALVDVLGDCGSLASIPFISINEATTAAAAWALAPFAQSVTAVGASSTNAAGLHNAMGNAMLLADSYTGLAPSSTLPSNASTETAKLYALANILSGCVNSDGTAPCTQLFNDASPATVSTLTDTFQAALSIVANPSHNVTGLFNDQPSHAVFASALTTPPSDWTMSISFTGGGLSSPSSIAVDASGNVLVSNVSGVVSGFSPQGIPLWSNGITGSGLDQSVGIAIDASSDIWITNRQSLGTAPGSLTRLTPAGTTLSGSDGFNGGSINQPVAVAADTLGNVWVANMGSPAITYLRSDGSALSGPAGFGSATLASPSAIAIDDRNTSWVADAGTGNIVHFNTSGTIVNLIPCCSSPDSLAFDSSGTLWAGDNTNSVLAQISTTGRTLASGMAGGGLSGPRNISFDGADQLWITNNSGSTLSEFQAGQPLSPAAGLGADANLNQPFGVGVDASGNVWVSSFGDNRLISFVGLGVPVKTPKFGFPQQP